MSRTPISRGTEAGKHHYAGGFALPLRDMNDQDNFRQDPDTGQWRELLPGETPTGINNVDTLWIVIPRENIPWLDRICGQTWYPDEYEILSDEEAEWVTSGIGPDYVLARLWWD